MRKLPFRRDRPIAGRWMTVASAVIAAVMTISVLTPTAASTAVMSTESLPSAIVPGGVVRAAPVVGFDPGTIIDDGLFFDRGAMSAADIQAFLDQKNRCTTGRCLNTSTASISSRSAVVSHRTGNLVCNAVEGGTMRTSELIYRVQVACGISAKVILVTLEKEQSLVTARTPTERNFLYAMGANCPDTAPCDPNFSGIGPQILAGVTSLKNYSAGAFQRQPGVHWIGYNPEAYCGGTNVNVTNYATAALYNYTPYQPNASALAAGYGRGDDCGSYGNRNFYNFYKEWFGAPTRAGWPVGNLELIEPVAGGFRIVGWAVDPDTTVPVQVHVYVGAVGTPFIADQVRPDVATAFPGLGDRHGFDLRVPATLGQAANVCVFAINVSGVGKGQNNLLGCQVAAPRTGAPEGALDVVAPVEGGVRVAGWAVDPDTFAQIAVHVYIDDLGYSLVAGAERPDLRGRLMGHGTRHGYDISLGTTPGPHRICVYAMDTQGGANASLGCRDVTVPPLTERARPPIGAFDEAKVLDGRVQVSGWAIDPDTASPISVHVYVGSQGSALISDQARRDVGKIYASYGSAHGFSATLDLPEGSTQICAYALDSAGGTNSLLGCKSVEYSRPLSSPPFGNLEEVTATQGGIRVSGWAIDRDSSAPTAIHVYVGQSGQAIATNVSRSDVVAAFGGPDVPRGFDAIIPVVSGLHTVCVYAINDAWGLNTKLGCREVDAP